MSYPLFALIYDQRFDVGLVLLVKRSQLLLPVTQAVVYLAFLNFKKALDVVKKLSKNIGFSLDDHLLERGLTVLPTGLCHFKHVVYCHLAVGFSILVAFCNGKF